MKRRFRFLLCLLLAVLMTFGCIDVPGFSTAVMASAGSSKSVVQRFDRVTIEVGETLQITDSDTEWILWTKADSYELSQDKYGFAEFDDWEWENFGCLEVTGVKEGLFTYTVKAYDIDDWTKDDLYDATYIFPVKVVAAGSKQSAPAVNIGNIKIGDDDSKKSSFVDDDIRIGTEAEKANIAACSISLSNNSFAYTGKAIKPTVTVTDGSKTLRKGTDYTVRFSKNKKVGNATVSVKGKGSYAGTLKKQFSIVPKLGVKIAELEPGETTNIKAKSSGKITYKSSDRSVATVSKKGVITGISEGSANITVTTNGKSSICEVIVYEPYDSYEDDEEEYGWDSDYGDNYEDTWDDDYTDPCEDGSCGHPECQPDYGKNNDNGNNDNNGNNGNSYTPANTEPASDGAFTLPSLTAINSGLQLTKEDMLKNFNISYYTYPMSKPEMNVAALLESIKTEMRKYGFEYATTYQLSSSYTKFFFTYVGDKKISPAGCTNNNDGRMYDMNVEYFKFSNQADGLQFSYPKEFVCKDAVEYREAHKATGGNNGGGGAGGAGGGAGAGGSLGIDCPSCIDGWALCWRCNNVTPDHRPCDTCHAHGYEYVGLKQITCRKCNNLKYLPCSICNGRGRLMCEVCYGTGTW